MSHVHGAERARDAQSAHELPDLVTEPQGASLGTLVSQLSTQLPELIRSELRLAQAEVAEKGKRAGIGIGMFSVAGLLGFFGLAVLIATAVLALDLVLPVWAAALIVAAGLLAVAGVAALLGKKKVAEVGTPAPERAISGIKKDVATVKGERR
jgi:MFS family permease